MTSRSIARVMTKNFKDMLNRLVNEPKGIKMFMKLKEQLLIQVQEGFPSNFEKSDVLGSMLTLILVYFS